MSHEGTASVACPTPHPTLHPETSANTSSTNTGSALSKSQPKGGPTRHSHLAGLASSIDSRRPSPAPPQTESGNEHSATSRAVQTSHINDNQPPCVTAVYHRAPTAPVQLCTLRHINTFFFTQATNPTLLINGLIVVDTNNNTMNSPLRKERYTHTSLSCFSFSLSFISKWERKKTYPLPDRERGTGSHELRFSIHTCNHLGM